MFSKRSIFLVIVCLSMVLLCACSITDSQKEADEQAKKDCKQAMMQVREIYIAADKGTSLNAVIDKETAVQMLLALQESGYPVTLSGFTYNMANYEKMEKFLEDSLNGKSGEIVTYEIHTNGGIGRRQFIFDGEDMYVLSIKAAWTEENDPVIADTSYIKIKEWKYTEKGYFSFAYSVPEPPKVSEVVNGDVLIRVKPQEEKNMEIAEKYIFPIGYQGNNFLCSNWDTEHLEDLDYNGLYLYLYRIKNQRNIDPDQYTDGIPKKEFEDLMTEFLPVSVNQLQEYAVFDEERQTYVWDFLNCFTYAPDAFGTSIPEVTDIVYNEDGTISIYIDAVCAMAGEDCVMSHVLKARIQNDGSITYLGNEILDDGLEKIPEYQYRFL